MNRWITIITTLSLVLIVTPACDEPDEAEEQETEEQQEEEADEADETAQAQQADDVPTDPEAVMAEMAAIFTSFASNMSQLNEIRCGCGWEEMGYDSQEECQQVEVADDERLQAFSECVAKKGSDVEEDAPASVAANFQCVRQDVLPPLDECVGNAIEAHGDSCSDEALEARHECRRAIAAGMTDNDCEEPDEGTEWLGQMDIFACHDEYNMGRILE